ncbi:Ig domain protein, group 2 domain protein [Psychromonas sp. CNPT3]|uniref:Ig-like domain-containing protein n=1 Tax=Psychromonas sp. CNPT3 TaxID=314282 RepID=UPI00006E3C0E|nr:Ig-like domain-containing protein [Psychromonas sp. CNPT3]AGH81348.1 Ig domain protein, group 2 domain protein [Psychromonas sp. CNPT3]
MINHLKYVLFFLASLMLTACDNDNESEGVKDAPELGERVSALQITPAKASVIVGLHQQFKATAIMFDDTTVNITTHDALKWSSGDTSIATVEPNTGTVTAIKSGIVDIIATGSTDEKTFTEIVELTVINANVTSLQVTPAIASAPVGFSQQYKAQATLTNNWVIDVTLDPALSWRSDNTSVATIDTHTGWVTGVAVGTVNITASGTANKGFFTQTVEFEVTDAIVTSLQVTPAIASLAVGISRPFQALITLSDDSVIDVTTDPALSWRSDNPSIATIDTDTGIATGVITGDVSISASGTADGHHFSEHVALTVTDAIVTSLHVTPATATIIEGLSQQFEAQATLSDDSVIDIMAGSAISWTSDNTSVASIDVDTGIATGLVPGTVNITAAGSIDGHHYSKVVKLTVINALVESLILTPSTLSIPKGFSEQFEAFATLSNGSVVDVTTDSALSWKSSDIDKFTIDSDTGIATGVNISTGATITALLVGQKTFSATSSELQVTKAVMIRLEVTSPSTNELTLGSRRQFTAKVIFSDGKWRDVTNDADIIWQTTNSATASMTDGSEAPYYKAVAVSHSVEHVGIFASYAGFTSSKIFLSIIPEQSTACSVPSITQDGLIYDCPPTQEQADLLEAQYTKVRVETDGKMSPVGMRGVAFTQEQARDFCASQGKRLPTLTELRRLYKETKHNDTDAALYLNYGWPLKYEDYWVEQLGRAARMTLWPEGQGWIESKGDVSLYTICVKAEQ